MKYIDNIGYNHISEIHFFEDIARSLLDSIEFQIPCLYPILIVPNPAPFVFSPFYLDSLWQGTS